MDKPVLAEIIARKFFSLIQGHNLRKNHLNELKFI